MSLDFLEPMTTGKEWMKYSYPKADWSLAYAYSESIDCRQVEIKSKL